MSGLASLQGAAGLPVPVAQTFHALGSVKARHQGVKDTSPPERIGAEREVGLACDQVIATCHDEVRELGQLGLPSGKVSVVPCGVDTGTFWPFGAAAPRSFPARLLTLGRLVERKGNDIAIAALPQLPGAELVVAGGPRRDQLGEDAEYRRLRDLAEMCGVAGLVSFTGAVPRPQVPALIRSADVVVCTPWYEPFGITPLEAMACGIPVVASAVGGLTDSVVHGTTGLLIPARDPDALAAAAGVLLADPALRSAFGEAGARRARRWYSWPRVAAQTESVYLRLSTGLPPGTDKGEGRSLAVGTP
jgi:glycosyltransferase involved in cell wall biosynthesis